MTEMPAATVTVMACTRAAESRLVITAQAADVWLGCLLVVTWSNSWVDQSLLPGADTPVWVRLLDA